jgi:putative membrane protein
MSEARASKAVEGHVARQAEGVRASAEHLERSAGAVKDSADRRTELAADRTVLAAERTYAAWVRTGLAALASGVGAKAVFAKVLPGWLGTLTGSVLILFGAFCFAAAVWRETQPGAPPPKPDTPKLPGWALLSVNGFLIVVCLAALAGVWSARG